MADNSILNIPTPETPFVPETPTIEVPRSPSQGDAVSPEVLEIKDPRPIDSDSTLAADSIASKSEEDRTDLATTMPITANGTIAAGPEISKASALEDSISALFINE